MSIMTGGTELATLLQTKWSAKFFPTKRANLVFEELTNDDYQGDASILGNAIRINTVPDFDEADLLPEGASADSDTVTTTSQTLTINKRPHKDVIVEDMAKLQSVPFMDKLEEAMIYSILRRVQTEIIAVFVPSTSAPDHAISYDSGSTLGKVDILEAKELMDTANVPMSDRYMVVGAAQLNDLFNISEFTSRDYNGGETVFNTGTFSKPFLGFVGKFTTAVSSVTYCFQRAMIAAVYQKQLNVTVADGAWSGARAKRINADLLMGVRQLDDERGVTIS